MIYFKKCGIRKEITNQEPDIRILWVPIRYAVHDSIVDIQEDDGSWTTGFTVYYVEKRKLSDQELRDYGKKFGNVKGVTSPNDIE
jgi:hypothetical protein